MSSELQKPSPTEASGTIDVLPAFSDYINSGLSLMREREFVGAMTHFRNPIPATNAGAYLIDYTPWIRAVRTKADLEKLNQSFSPSGIMEGEENGKPSITIAGYNLGSDFTHDDVFENVKHQVTLCFAEEWLHAQQRLKAQRFGAWMYSLVEDRPLEDIIEVEQDIAFYLHKMSVPLDVRFLNGYHRYEAFQAAGIPLEDALLDRNNLSGLSA